MLAWRNSPGLARRRRGGGTAAAFNAPVAGAIFVLEELTREFELHTAIAAIGASATAISVSQALLGTAPDFHVGKLAYVGVEVGPCFSWSTDYEYVLLLHQLLGDCRLFSRWNPELAGRSTQLVETAFRPDQPHCPNSLVPGPGGAPGTGVGPNIRRRAMPVPRQQGSRIFHAPEDRFRYALRGSLGPIVTWRQEKEESQQRKPCRPKGNGQAPQAYANLVTHFLNLAQRAPGGSNSTLSAHLAFRSAFPAGARSCRGSRAGRPALPIGRSSGPRRTTSWVTFPNAPGTPAASDLAAVHEKLMRFVLPYGTGNVHPNFMGWIHGGGTPAGILVEMPAARLRKERML